MAAARNDLAAALTRVEPGGIVLVDGEAGTQLAGDITTAINRGVSIQGLAPGSLTEALKRLALRDVCESLSKVREESLSLSNAPQALAKACTPGALQILVDNL